jgi:hypothetical protein
MFIISWLFDKLGYMPKIKIEVGKVNLDLEGTWPFPAPKEELKKKPAAKKVIVSKKPKAATKATKAK